jgi:gamma-glutamyltranspeptidase / glutathione hydrolase
MPTGTWIALVLCLFPVALAAQDRSHARSMVITTEGIVATSHVQASIAGAQILARGGSAVDAAIAANAVLGVTEPMMNGMGGDLFALYWDAKTGKLYGLNSSGWAPQALTPPAGIDSVTVPGAVAGWNALHDRFGRIAWQELFQPAIYYAEKGYPVPELIHGFWDGEDASLTNDPESARVYLPGGHPPEVGEIFRNPDLAKALRLVAESGANAYYKGDIARAILRTSQELGGTMSADDLAGFSPEWVEPISTTYRGWTVYELPPNEQGMAALEMLNIMETSPAAPEGAASAAEVHKRIEAMKLAYSGQPCGE